MQKLEPKNNAFERVEKRRDVVNTASAPAHMFKSKKFSKKADKKEDKKTEMPEIELIKETPKMDEKEDTLVDDFLADLEAMDDSELGDIDDEGNDANKLLNDDGEE